MTSIHEIAAELQDRHAAWLAGWDQGYAAGRNDRRTDAQAVALHEAAAEVVTRMAGYPERDPEADRAAAQRRGDRFSQPRFGGAA